MYRPVLLEAGRSVGLCLLRDLSIGGMRGKPYTYLASGERVRVHFSTELTIGGSVAWLEDGMIGIDFDTIIDIAQMLGHFGQGGASGKVARSPRLPIQCNGFLQVTNHTAMVPIEDISQRGAKIRASFLQPNEGVVLQLDGLERRKAVVRWTAAGVAGLNFLRPLTFDELAHWTSHQLLKPIGSGSRIA